MTTQAPQPQAARSAPIVAIVGRPNVGKSSLFNALLGRRTAVVSEVAGTTRDRLSGDLEHDGRRLLVVDTGGLVPTPETAMEANIAEQVRTAIADADVIVFVTDVTQGVTHTDQHIAQQLRSVKKPVVLVANKADNQRLETFATELYELALGDPIPVSALHRHGISDLLDAVADHLPRQDAPAPEGPTAPRFAIVGRPNVGKSALANAIARSARHIVSEVPGTTRDAIDTPFAFADKEGVLIDTAGIRRRGAIQPGIEKYSVLRAVRAIDRCDVAILVLDASELATAQDQHVAGEILESFKGCVVVVNKWDLVEETGERKRDVAKYVLQRLRFMDYVPVVFTSAINGEGVDHLLRTAFSVYDQWQRSLPPADLTRVVMSAIARHMPPRQGNRQMKIYRVKQESVAPPTFVFYCNNPHLMHFSYERYLENEMRSAFGFTGCHLRLEFRGKGKIHVIGEHRAGDRLTEGPARRPAR